LGLGLNDIVTEKEADDEDIKDDAFYDDSNPRQLMGLPSINEEEELSYERAPKSFRRKSIQKYARRASRKRTRSSSAFHSTRLKSMHEVLAHGVFQWQDFSEISVYKSTSDIFKNILLSIQSRFFEFSLFHWNNFSNTPYIRYYL